MSITEATLQDFLKQIDPDDLEYAQELLDQYQAELKIRADAIGLDFEAIMFDDDITVPVGSTIH
jgi:hypothetical protein